MGDQPKKADYVVVVVHGLPGTHDHHVGYPLSGDGLNPVDLIQHLRGTQIALQTIQGRGAESAAHAAANL